MPLGGVVVSCELFILAPSIHRPRAGVARLNLSHWRHYLLDPVNETTAETLTDMTVIFCVSFTYDCILGIGREGEM